jgi:hypothetical protein
MGWLTDAQFLDAVAVALITQVPSSSRWRSLGTSWGVAGATLAAIGIFLPVYFFTIVARALVPSYRDNPQLRAFAAGATAAAGGDIAGAVVVLGRGAMSESADGMHRAERSGSARGDFGFRKPLLVLGPVWLALRSRASEPMRVSKDAFEDGVKHAIFVPLDAAAHRRGMARSCSPSHVRLRKAPQPLKSTMSGVYTEQQRPRVKKRT